VEGTTTIDASAQRNAPAADANPADEWFERFANGLDEPDFLVARRRAAWARCAQLPMPTRKTEEWRYTDVSQFTPESFEPVSPKSEMVAFEDLPQAVRDVIEHSHERAGIFVQRNGAAIHMRLDADVEARGVVLAPISDVARERPELLEKYLYGDDVTEMEEKFWTLHAAMLTGGYLLHVPENTRIEHPVHAFRYVDCPGSLVSTHTLIVAEPGSEITCIDEYISPDLEETTTSLAGVEIVGEAGADVHYVSLQRYGKGIQHFSIQHVTADRDTRINGFNVTLGGDLTRSDVSSRLTGPGAEGIMLALWFGDRDQHIDHHTLQEHAAPHAHSDLLYKGALTDSARSVFRGLIRVMPGAQLTDAYQTNRNLLLSEDASATALPNLEIEADDVRCSHGATIGQVEERQMFYLMSRGVTRQQAERLLVLGFFDEVLAKLTLEGVRTRVRAAIARKLGV
jgi:Fe-S cluster assembly protein SufD